MLFLSRRTLILGTAVGLAYTWIVMSLWSTQHQQMQGNHAPASLSTSPSPSLCSSNSAVTVNKTSTESSTNSYPLPHVAWLLSYPNSGTTYTLKLIQQDTNTTTATNYGNEQDRHVDSKSIYSNHTQGPFYRYLEKYDMPRHTVLVKTHCGGTKISGRPQDYILTQRQFDVACRVGHRILDGGTKVPTIYNHDMVQRIVHLIRNPFSNLVARLHMQLSNWADKASKQSRLQRFNDTKAGLEEWCRYLDESGKDMEADYYKQYDPDLWKIAQDMHCHAEWIRYTQWHNLATSMSRRKRGTVLPTLVLHYEDYETSWSATVQQLFDFLQLQPARGATPLAFVPGKTYADFFSNAYRQQAKALVQELATPETWALLQHYFDDD